MGLFDVEVEALVQAPVPDRIHDLWLADDVDAIGDNPEDALVVGVEPDEETRSSRGCRTSCPSPRDGRCGSRSRRRSRHRRTSASEGRCTLFAISAGANDVRRELCVSLIMIVPARAQLAQAASARPRRYFDVGLEVGQHARRPCAAAGRSDRGIQPAARRCPRGLRRRSSSDAGPITNRRRSGRRVPMRAVDGLGFLGAVDPPRGRRS